MPPTSYVLSLYYLYLNAYFDYTTGKEYQHNIPYRGNCGKKL